MTHNLTLSEAKARYVHRFTADHVPQWAQQQRQDGTYYAPQFASDAEWYARTLFPGEAGHPFPKSRRGDCYTSGQTWPFGQSLAQPFRTGRA